MDLPELFQDWSGTLFFASAPDPHSPLAYLVARISHFSSVVERDSRPPILSADETTHKWFLFFHRPWPFSKSDFFACDPFPSKRNNDQAPFTSCGS